MLRKSKQQPAPSLRLTFRPELWSVDDRQSAERLWKEGSAAMQALRDPALEGSAWFDAWLKERACDHAMRTFLVMMAEKYAPPSS
jgi:hypothetical protein